MSRFILLANAGTPLLLTVLFHLCIGNFLLGIFEGVLLVLLFVAKEDRTHAVWAKFIAVMIIANYFSWWVGGYLLNDVFLKQFDVTVNNYWQAFYSLFVLAFIITLILEWLFVFGLFFNRKNKWLTSVKGDITVHVLSYLLLIVIYRNGTEDSLIRNLEIDKADKFNLPRGYMLFYISKDGEKVERYDFETKLTREVLATGVKNNLGVLLASNNDNGENSIEYCIKDYDDWDFLFDFEGKRGTGKEVIRGSDISLVRSKQLVPVEVNLEAGTYSKVASFQNVHDLNVYTKKWGRRGIHVFYKEKFISKYEIESIAGSWLQFHVVHLPGDLVLFQLGKDQICVIDLKEKKIALLARGSSPVVVKKINYTF